MHLLDFTLYGFGQFLQILLWIFLPVFILSLLVTTYLHHLRRNRLSYAGNDYHPVQHDPTPINRMYSDGSSSDHALTGDFFNDEHSSTPKETDNPYKGLLWMKNKYEQDRDLADAKYERLMTDYRRSEERMTIMVAEQASLREQLEKKELRILFLQGQLDDRQSWIEGQQERTQQEKARYEELVAKLEFSSQLLLKIHKELDLSKKELKTDVSGIGDPTGIILPAGEDLSITPEAHSFPETKIVSWIESGSTPS